MKKFKLYLVVAILIAMVLSFTSCAGASGRKDISDAFIKGSTPISSLTAKSGSHISSLDGADYVSSEGSLICMSKAASGGGTKYIIFNLSTGEKEHEVTSTPLSPASVELYHVYADGVYVDFFTVATNDTYTLYSATGDILVSSDESINVLASACLVYIDGYMYEISKDGITKAFEYSKLSKIPDNLSKYGKYYYSSNSNDSITVYNSELEFLSHYDAPSYADNTTMVILENGNILFQHTFLADQSSDDYTLMIDDEKHNIVTEIFKVRSGKVKEIKCNYFILFADNALVSSFGINEKIGINDKKFPVTGLAVQIKDQLIDAAGEFVSIKNNGNIKPFNKINGEIFMDIDLIANNRWIVSAGNRSYILTNKGKVLGDVSGSTVYGQYLVADNGIYNPADLSLIYEYENKDNDYYIYGELGASLILKSNKHEEYKLFTGTSTLTPILNKGEAKSLIYHNDHMYAISSNGNITFYNNTGVSVYSCAAIGSINYVYSIDDCYIFSTENSSGDDVYHMITLG